MNKIYKFLAVLALVVSLPLTAMALIPLPVNQGGTGVNTITGIIKGNGTAPFSAAVAGTDYLTGNQTITLSGDVSGSGATSITTTIGAGKVTNAMLANSTISGIALGANLANLTATNTSLTFSGSYNGGTARTVGLNLANANTWTGQQTFNTSAPIFGTITGSTQCLHVDTSGLLSGTGSDCGAGGGGLTVGTTAIASGTNGRVLYDNSGVLGELVNTGTGNNVLQTSPTLVTPLLGVPTSGDFSTGTFTWPTFNQNTTGSAAKWTTARNLAGNSVDGSANVAFANKFIVQGTTDAGLSAAQFLGALGTGLVKNTTTTGILSIASAGTDYEVPLTFSTGLTRSTNTVTVNTSQNIATLSNLTSNGLVTTSGSAGTLGVTVPGTGVLTALGVNVGSAGAFVTFNGALGTPSSGTLTNATGCTISGCVSGLGTGVATFLGTPSSANLATALTDETGTAGNAVFSTNPTLSGFTMADATNIVLNTTTGTKIGTATGQKLAFFNSTPVAQQTGNIITGLSNLGLITSGTISNANVGATATPTASTISTWDANVNFSAGNSLITGFATTATAAGTTTLAITDKQIQVFTGSSTQTVKLPTTSVVAGATYKIINQSTGAVTVQSSGANTITILDAGTSALFTAVVATPTTAANWNSEYLGLKSASGKSLTVSNTLTLAGTDGKGINVGAATSGKFLIGDGSNEVLSAYTLPTSAPASGKIFVSDGTNVVASTPTFPNASATSGKIIKSDGTNWTASTETYAAPGTSGNIMKSDGTNWTSAAPTSASLSYTNGVTTFGAGSSPSAITIAHGLGASPTRVEIDMMQGGVGTQTTDWLFSNGHWDTNGQSSVYSCKNSTGAPTAGTNSSNALNWNDCLGDTITGAVTVDATNITLTFAGAASAGTMQIHWSAEK